MRIRMSFDLWLTELQAGYIGKQSGNLGFNYKWENERIKKNHTSMDDIKTWRTSVVEERPKQKHEETIYSIDYGEEEITRKIELIIEGIS